MEFELSSYSLGTGAMLWLGFSLEVNVISTQEAGTDLGDEKLGQRDA